MNQQEARQALKAKAPQIEHGEVAGTTDTLDPTSHAPAPERSSEAELAKLESYLRQRFPGEVGRSNYVHAESPVDTAMRLLTLLSASTTSMSRPRCSESWCNLPQGHEDDHGWVVAAG